MSNYPPLPTARLDNLYSFYDYSISPRERAHASLRGESSSSASSSSSNPYPHPSSSTTRPRPRNGLFRPGPTLACLDERRHAAKRASERVARRAVRGERTAGSALAHDGQDLSDDEEMLERDKATINSFGFRFLMPFGRMMTQMEMEAAPSPTPSDPDHLQEDRNGHDHDASPVGSPVDEDDDVDLDASIEDRDDAGERDDDDDGDGGGDAHSTEYDSDDLRLMRAMDRSVGSRTPGTDEEDMDEE